MSNNESIYTVFFAMPDLMSLLVTELDLIITWWIPDGEGFRLEINTTVRRELGGTMLHLFAYNEISKIEFRLRQTCHAARNAIRHARMQEKKLMMEAYLHFTGRPDDYKDYVVFSSVATRQQNYWFSKETPYETVWAHQENPEYVDVKSALECKEADAEEQLVVDYDLFDFFEEYDSETVGLYEEEDDNMIQEQL